MVTVYIRTLIIYIILISAMRLMGKRQIGELQVAELVTTLMISELAVIPMQNTDTPVAYSVIPIVLLLSIEVISSFVLTKCAKLRSIFHGKPSIIILRGKLIQSELSRLRINLNELLSELRLKDISDIDDVEYAILEENGKLSVFTKREKNNFTPADAGLKPEENGIAHAVIIDGSVSDINLALAQKDRRWLDKYLKENNYLISDVFMMTVDDAGKINVIKRDKDAKNK
jgi:uncharacterized membrane protein YcaP (DUF421 family)